MQLNENILTYLTAAIEDAIDRAAYNLATMTDSKGRRRVATGRTLKDIHGLNKDAVSVNGENVVVQVEMPGNWRMIDEGIKGLLSTPPHTSQSPFIQKKMPPIQEIESWITARGITPLAVGKNPRRRLAYAIAKSIKEQGIERVPFYSSVFNLKFEARLIKDIEEVGAEGFEDEIDDVTSRMVARLRNTGVDVRYDS